jgi:hypothetical protein
MSFVSRDKSDSLRVGVKDSRDILGRILIWIGQGTWENAGNNALLFMSTTMDRQDRVVYE